MAQERRRCQGGWSRQPRTEGSLCRGRETDAQQQPRRQGRGGERAPVAEEELTARASPSGNLLAKAGVREGETPAAPHTPGHAARQEAPPPDSGLLEQTFRVAGAVRFPHL